MNIKQKTSHSFVTFRLQSIQQFINCLSVHIQSEGSGTTVSPDTDASACQCLIARFLSASLGRDVTLARRLRSQTHFSFSCKPNQLNGVAAGGPVFVDS